MDKIPLLLNLLSDVELQTLAGRGGMDFFHFNRSVLHRNQWPSRVYEVYSRGNGDGSIEKL